MICAPHAPRSWECARGGNGHRVLDAGPRRAALLRAGGHARDGPGPGSSGARLLGPGGRERPHRVVEGDARETIPNLSGPFDLLFVDAAKGQYREYIELAEPLLSERAALVIDNLLVGGEVAVPEGAQARAPAESIASARTLNPELLDSENWLGSVLPIGDGVGFAARL